MSSDCTVFEFHAHTHIGRTTPSQYNDLDIYWNHVNNYTDYTVDITIQTLRHNQTPIGGAIKIEDIPYTNYSNSNNIHIFTNRWYAKITICIKNGSTTITSLDKIIPTTVSIGSYPGAGYQVGANFLHYKYPSFPTIKTITTKKYSQTHSTISFILNQPSWCGGSAPNIEDHTITKCWIYLVKLCDWNKLVKTNSDNINTIDIKQYAEDYVLANEENPATLTYAENTPVVASTQSENSAGNLSHLSPPVIMTSAPWNFPLFPADNHRPMHVSNCGVYVNYGGNKTVKCPQIGMLQEKKKKFLPNFSPGIQQAMNIRYSEGVKGGRKVNFANRKLSPFGGAIGGPNGVRPYPKNNFY